MFPLAAVSVYMLTLIIDSVRRIQNKVVCPPDIVNLLRSQFSAGDYNAAFQTCRSKACFLTNVVRAGLSMLGQGKEITEKAMEDVMAKEIAINEHANLLPEPYRRRHPDDRSDRNRARNDERVQNAWEPAALAILLRSPAPSVRCSLLPPPVSSSRFRDSPATTFSETAFTLFQAILRRSSTTSFAGCPMPIWPE